MERKRKPVWVVLGWAALALAVVGIFLPVVPQVPFAILAAFFFSKGSPRLHRWVLNNKHFGPAVRDWEIDQVIRPRLKRASIAMMIGGAGLAFWKYGESNPVIGYGMPVLFLIACFYVATRRSESRPVSEPGFEVRLGNPT